LVETTDKIARVRAHLLHALHEIGREDHQFRLRYKGQYLRDAFYLEDYDIGDNAVVKMVPMSKRNDVNILASWAFVIIWHPSSVNFSHLNILL
jgi:hypothetical protein